MLCTQTGALSQVPNGSTMEHAPALGDTGVEIANAAGVPASVAPAPQLSDIDAET